MSEHGNSVKIVNPEIGTRLQMEEEGFEFLSPDEPVLAEVEVILPQDWHSDTKAITKGVFIYDSTGAVRYMCHFKERGSPPSFDALRASWRSLRKQSSVGLPRSSGVVKQLTPFSRVDRAPRRPQFSVRKTA
jgi:hypothetical protein